MSALLLLACGPEPDSKGAEDSAGTETTDSGLDSDSDSDSDTNSDTDTALDTDTGSTPAPRCTDTGVALGLELGLGEADAKLVGEAALDGGDDGFSIAGAGDLDGDSHDDLALGFSTNDRAGASAGAVFVLAGPVSGTMSVAEAEAVVLGGMGGTNDYYGNRLGYAVAGAGDVDADGYDDLLIGAPWFVGEGSSIAEGQAYIFRGPLSGERDWSSADSILHGEARSDTSSENSCYAGMRLSPAGDTDGDGFDDVLVGAPGCQDTFLVRGPMAAYVELASEADATWSKIGSTALVGGGDLDGDGLADVVLAASYEDAAMGPMLFSGPLSGDVDVGEASAVFTTEEEALHAGYYGMDITADVDGDGYTDFVFDTVNDGSIRVAYGPLGGVRTVESVVDEVVHDGSADGTPKADAFGASLDGVPDMDGDGRDEILVGLPYREAEAFDGPGGAMLFLGPICGTVPSADADLLLRGEGGDDQAGWEVAHAGDVDADGIPDLLVGGPQDDDGGEDAGAAWLILGATALGGG